MKVNLLTERRQVFSINWTEVISYLLVILFFLLLGINYYLNYNKLTLLQSKVNNIDKQLAVFLPKQEEYLDLQKKVRKFQNNRVHETVLVENRWGEVLKELGYVTPESTLLKSLQIDGLNININGVTGESGYLLNLIGNMRKSPYFNNIRLNRMDRRKEISFNIKAQLAGEGD